MGSKGTSDSLPQSEHVHGYIFLSDMLLRQVLFATIRTNTFDDCQNLVQIEEVIDLIERKSCNSTQKEPHLYVKMEKSEFVFLLLIDNNLK